MRLSYDRQAQLEHLRLTGWRVLRYKSCSLVVAWREIAGGKIDVKAWRGKCDKPMWYYTCRDAKSAEALVADYAKRIELNEGSKKARKESDAAARAKLKASDFWAVGDVVYNSWGYDQTNIDWYQVVEVLPRSVRIREIAGNSNDHGGPSGGRTAPRRNDFTGEPMLKPVDAEGRIAARHGCMSKWDGKAKVCSSYH